MAATIASRTESATTSAGTSHVVSYTQTTGDLVVIFMSTAVSTAVTMSESFTNLTNVTNTFHIFYKILDGSEGGSTTFTTSSSKSASIAYNIQGYDSAIAPEISTVATGTSTAPNATTVTPAAGSKEYLWISAFGQAGEEADDDTWCTAAPSTPSAFGNLSQKTSGTAGPPSVNCSVASADLTSTATSCDAGAFTTAQSLAWRAYTVAISPATTAIKTIMGLAKASVKTVNDLAIASVKTYNGLA